jgi:hypothetical protein
MIEYAIDNLTYRVFLSFRQDCRLRIIHHIGSRREIHMIQAKQESYFLLNGM